MDLNHLTFSAIDGNILVGAVAVLIPVVGFALLSTVKAQDLLPQERTQRIMMIAVSETAILAGLTLWLWVTQL